MRHFTHTQKALDEIAEIVCKEKQAEIDALKAYIKRIGDEGRELARKYSFNPDSPIDIFSDAHDLHDFLEAL